MSDPASTAQRDVVPVAGADPPNVVPVGPGAGDTADPASTGSAGALLRAQLWQERAARVAAEQECERLTVLAQVSERFATTLDPAAALQLLATQVVPRLGRWCATYMPGTQALIGQVFAHHQDGADPVVQADLERFTARAGDALSAEASIKRVLRGEIPDALILRMDDASTGPSMDGDREMVEICSRLGLGSAIVAPLSSRGRLLGVFHVTGGVEREEYTPADVRLVVELAHRAALALDNARLYSHERSIAETLQRSLLPAVPVIDAMRIVAQYLPATDGASIGGDWFDALPLPDGATGLAIGDVTGHDIAAAAAMGQLSSVLRSYAWEGAAPTTVLDRLDRLVQGLGMAVLASCVYARVEPADTQGRRLLRWGNAGHLPPLLRRPDGDTVVLDGAPGMLIGVPRTDGTVAERTEGSVVIEPGSLLLLYTDGVVESPGRDIVDGIEQLRTGLSRINPSDLTEDSCSGLVQPCDGAAPRDDVAMLMIAFD
jgi:serine phosphatase RsbU (regulator of sigma subunit)